jgi:hypothetical protein
MVSWSGWYGVAPDFCTAQKNKTLASILPIIL